MKGNGKGQDEEERRHYRVDDAEREDNSGEN